MSAYRSLSSPGSASPSKGCRAVSAAHPLQGWQGMSVDPAQEEGSVWPSQPTIGGTDRSTRMLGVTIERGGR